MIKEIKWSRKRRLAPVLSALVPGLGQAFTGRWSAAAAFFLLFAMPAFFLVYLRMTPNVGHYIMAPLLFLAWLINLADSWFGTTSPTAPCIEACPAHINIPHYINLVVEKRYEDCHSLITRWTPLVGTIGHVCHHPCEFKCTRFTFDEPVAICPLKAYVGDHMIKNDLLRGSGDSPPGDKAARVAVVGSGPAGLSAAYYLARLGLRPTVYEALPVAGGMLAVGIPSYRLPRRVLKKEIAFIQEAGVEIRTGVRVGEDVSVKDLLGEGHRAVFAAPGTHRETLLRIEGEEKKGVIPGMRFLRSVNLGEITSLEGQVLVVGGGNVAMDAARSALRLGASKVTIIYRRSRREMPAHNWEVSEAEEEGVEFLFLTNPVKVHGGSSVSQVECLEMMLGEPDESGRRRPVPVEGSNFTLPCDHLIPAIGLNPEASFMEEAGARLSARGRILTRKGKAITHTKGIYAGGDAVTGPSSVIQASFQGRQAAMEIFRRLSGRGGLLFPRIKVGKAQSEFAARPRVKQDTRHPEDRRESFSLIHRVYGEEDCLSEARRCLRCDLDM